MQEVGNEGVHGSEAIPGRDIDPEAALARLEDRVAKAVERIRALTEERDELQATVEKSEATLAEKEEALATASGDSEQVGALEARLKELGEERDRLREERTSAALRVEAILERLEALGLE
jgi:chromosome segregation ATPase